MPTALINNMHTINLRGVLTCHRTAVGQVSVYFVQTGRNDFLKPYLQKWGWIRRMNPAASVVQNGAGAMGCL